MPEDIKKKKKKTAAQRKKEKKRKLRRKRWSFVLDVGKTLYSWATSPAEKQSRLKPKVFGRTLTYAGFVIGVVVIIIAITLMLNNRALTVRHEQLIVTGLPTEFEGYRILVLSDLSGRSFGEDQSTLMRKLAPEKYDAVVYLGDMTSGSGNPQAFYTLIEQIGTRKPTFFIAGDSDPSPVLSAPRVDGVGDLTVNEMVLADWVLGAMDRGAQYLDMPKKITKGSATLWLMPDTFLNLDVTAALEEYKDELTQESESYLEGVLRAKDTLPLTTYRRNLLFKSQSLIGSMSDTDVILMLSHEVPSDSQLTRAQDALSETDKKNYFVGPDVVLSGHYCGGEWKFPLLGTMYADTNILPRYGWFPDDAMVQGQRTVGTTIVYTTAGLGDNKATVLRGRLNNPPEITILTLTGELPVSFLE